MGKPDESEAHPGLDVAEDLELERREWGAERFAWLILAVVIAAAVAGVFGRGVGGPSVKSSSGDVVTVEYDRFLRRGLRTDVTVQIAAAEGEELGLAISEAYLEDLRVEDILPEPDSTSVKGSDVLYRFAVEEPGRPMKVRFSFTPETPWGRQGTVLLDGTEEQVAFDQFTYP